MSRRIPTVHNGTLFEYEEGTASLDAIVLESTAWYDWLEHHHSFRFVHPAMTFTARKEQRAGSWYWYAYRRQAGCLRTAYLGRSVELSLSRLEAIAVELVGTGGPPTARTAAGERVPIPPASPSSQQANAAPAAVPPHNLPRQLTSLVGREQEVAAAGALLRHPEVSLLSLVGMPGVGKTRLALQVATDLLDDFPHGVFFVDLAPVHDPQQVPSTIAQTLGLRAIGDHSLLDMLKDYLRDRYCLLVLDNFEQVVSAAPQLQELLRACPGVKLLVTSREVLRLRAEHQFSVPPLALPQRKQFPDVEALAHVAAVELFLQRAQAIRSDFQLTKDNAAALAEICIRLDGLPLAIELAAARVKLLPPQALLARLDRRLQVLTGGARDLPERHQTLHSTIEWSYELLSMEEQRLFRHLSIFVGGATLEVIEAITTALGDDPAWVLDGVASLIDKSLLPQVGQQEEEPRFTMLETIRGYGLERLAASGELEIARQEHAAYYLRLAEQTAEELDGPQQAAWFERLMREHENLRAVLHWSLERAPVGEAEHPLILGLRLAKAMRAFWVMRGFCREGLDFLQRVLARDEGIISTSERARALDQAGSLAHFLGKTDRAEALLKESLRLRRELADAQGIASSLLRLGMIAMDRGDFPAARSLTEEVLLLFRTQENQERITWTLFQLTGIVCQQGDYSLAYTLGKECLARYKEQGDTKGVANSLYQLAEVLFDSGGNLETAHSLLQEAAELFEQVDDKSPFYLVLPGLVALQRGDVATARLLAEESLSRAREGDAPDDLALALALQGRVNVHQGDLTAARAFYEESLSIARQMDLKGIMALGLEGLAVVVAAQGEPSWAVRLCGAAESLREVMGTPLPAVWRADYEQVVAVARSALKERTFSTLWAEGRSLSLEHILADQEPRPVLTAPSSRVLTLAPIATIVSLPARVTSPIVYPDGLTSREVEVLRLLATGLTNVQVAEHLIISPRTVDSHLTSIYSKIGVSTRSAATRYALDHHLV